jgi:hypothetical protein
MHENILADAARMTDEALLAHVGSLARRERDATVELVGHLAELDGRKLHLGEGPGSLYKYCRDVLGYSEDAAWNRAATANVVRRYPFVLGWLADGSLSVTTVRILRRLLTSENHLDVLAEARHRSKKEVELIEARLNPKPDVPSTIRKVPAPAASLPMSGTLPVLDDGGSAPPAVIPAPGSTVAAAAATLGDGASPSARPVVAPLTPERYRLQFTVSKETHDKLRHLQDLLCREIPDHVHRAVWERDGAQCAFVGNKGRCTERQFLEWHHVQPHGHHGPPTVANISLRCAAHNAYESELVFGRFVPRTDRGAGANPCVSREISPFRNGGAPRK